MNFDFVTPQLFMNKGFKSGSVDSSSLSGQNFADSDSASNLFLNKLHQILAKNGIKQNLLSTVGGQGALIGSNNSTVGATSSEIDVLSEDAKMDLLKDVKNTQGFEFLTKFKQYLMASGHNDLKAISLDEDALETIKSMLVKAGFPQSRIADLIKTLRSESDDGNVLMSDLMDGLLSLDPDEIFLSDSPMDIDAFSIEIKDDQDDTSSDSNGKNFDVLMDISSIPFFTSIMKSLGIPDDVADSIISDSEVKGEGIHLNTLIFDLQKLQKNAFFTGTTFQASSDSESIKGMFNQLGISAEKSAVNGKINLGDFVSALEDFRQKSVSEKIGSNVLTGHSLSLQNSLNSFKTSNFSGLPNELSINGFNQSRNNSFSLIDNNGHALMGTTKNESFIVT
ncbi:MAG: hypothetical protein HQK65_11535, partial [Desulfamplus sp.]|nr:hypothetical protein [Desulfamplus sp.]